MARLKAIEVVQLRQKLTQVLETITPQTIASLTSYDFILEVRKEIN